MALDPERVAEVGAWLSKARNDLRGAEVDLAAQPPLCADAMFHAQQAAEKALKAFLAWHDVVFRKTHSIAELGRQCTAVDASLASVIAPAVTLTEFAWAYRYPGEVAEPSVADVQKALGLAEPVVAAVSQRIEAATSRGLEG